MQSKYSVHTIKSVMLGHAIGDALGVPVEFQSREDLSTDPVEGMRGYGSHAVPAGSWSDDTSMALCALDALVQGTFSWDTVMENFSKWLLDGDYTPTGEVFDSGRTCVKAVSNYFSNKAKATESGGCDELSNGNGSLMRIIPFALYAPDDLPFIEKASCLTHAHRRSQIACGIYSLVLSELIEKHEVGAYREGLKKAQAVYGAETEWQHFAPLLEIEHRDRDSIRSSGYVVDTLEAALWCLVTTDNYHDCVLKAVNLGDDTDTVAAVAGGLAGAVYGLDGIPVEWLDTLLRRDYIEKLCEKAGERWTR